MASNAIQAPVNLVNKHNVPLSYAKAKAKVIENQPVIAPFSLSNVELGRNCTIKVNGNQLPITQLAYSQFLKNVLDVQPQFVKRFRSVTDEKTELSMLGTLQKGLAMKKGAEVQVLANPKTNSIIGFQGKSFNYIPNSALLVIFERIMNEHPELQLKDLYINDQGEITMNVRSTRERDFGYNSSTSEKEEFIGGLTFRNSPTQGTRVGQNALRLVCGNGMIGFGFADKFHLSSNMGNKGMNDFFNAISSFAASGFIDAKMQSKISRAQDCQASVSEVRKMAALITKFSGVPKENVGSFLPIGDITKFLAKRGVQYAELKEGQAKNCPTGISLWDTLNHVTHFGSHDLGFNADFARIQAAAGFMLDRKEYDGENFVFLAN